MVLPHWLIEFLLKTSLDIKDKFEDLEKECIRPIIKASTGEVKECIFPPATEDELKQYPKTYEYLLSHKSELENRSITGSTK